MIKKITSLLIVIGLAMVGFSIYDYMSVQQEEAATVGEIEELLGKEEEEQGGSSWFSFFDRPGGSSSSSVPAEEKGSETSPATSVEENPNQGQNLEQADPAGRENFSSGEISGSDESMTQTSETASNSLEQADAFNPQTGDGIALLQIPSIGAELPVVEGVDANSLRKGVGHMTETVLPGQGEQILFSGHRDTTFTDFGELENGDRFIVELPYGTFEYEMRHSEIVDREDRSVIRPMGEEVLTLSTCYPFNYLGDSPERFIIYAYPV